MNYYETAMHDWRCITNIYVIYNKMISGISDLYILLIGMLYPSYKMLQQRDYDAGLETQSQRSLSSEEVTFWKQYFIIFSLFYVGSEVLEMSLHLILPLITLVQVVGVTLLVVPKTQTTQKLYINYLIPFYETHETLIKDTINDNIFNRNFKRVIDYVLHFREDS